MRRKPHQLPGGLRAARSTRAGFTMIEVVMVILLLGLVIAAVVVFTDSGSTARRVARERPGTPMLVLTPRAETARRVGLVWGAYAVTTRDIGSFEEMVAKGKRMALRHGFGKAGSRLIVIAGVPFGKPGATNLMHVVTLTGDELDDYED